MDKRRTALVTGASRGIGRGIAHELGFSGALVFITGRSVDPNKTTDGLPGTIHETAEIVNESGGEGIAVVCDHSDGSSVSELAKFIDERVGTLDVLVNNVWGGYEQYEPTVWELPPWEQPVWRWDKMFETGVRAHYLTTRSILPLMLEADNPIIINISAGDNGRFLGDVQYDVAKNAVDRLGFALARKLKRRGVIALTIHPGFTRTERVVGAFKERPLPPDTHSTRFVGRCVVALVGDPEIERWRGKSLKAGEIGLEYDLTDIDGSKPEPYCLPANYGE